MGSFGRDIRVVQKHARPGYLGRRAATIKAWRGGDLDIGASFGPAPA